MVPTKSVCIREDSGLGSPRHTGVSRNDLRGQRTFPTSQRMSGVMWGRTTSMARVRERGGRGGVVKTISGREARNDIQ